MHAGTYGMIMRFAEECGAMLSIITFDTRTQWD